MISEQMFKITKEAFKIKNIYTILVTITFLLAHVKPYTSVSPLKYSNIWYIASFHSTTSF